MTSLLDRAPTSDRPSRGGGGYRLPVVPRGRRPLVTVASGLLVLASIAIFASVYSSADHRVPVLVVTSTIRQGQPITGSALGTVDVAASRGLAMIPLADASELSRTWAAVTIPAGSLITPDDVTSSRPLATGSAVVGLALKAGQLPANGVEPGDQVMIVETPGVGAVLPVVGVTGDSGGATGSTGTGVLVSRATVFGTTTPSASSASGEAELVSVEVPSTLAAAVASASSASEVSLVLLPVASGSP